MTEHSRIVRYSGWLYWAAYALTYLLPLVMVGAIGYGYFNPDAVLQHFPVLAEGTPVSAFQGGLVAALAMLALFPMIAALLATRSLFDRYRHGEILSDANASDILRIGGSMLYVAGATVLVPMLQVLVLSWNSPARMVQLGIDGGTLGFLMSAGLLTVIGWAMRDAARVKAENEGFV